MSKTLKTVFRSYSSIEREVMKCRQLGGLAARMEYDIIAFIEDVLLVYYKGRLEIKKYPDNDLSLSAKVEISRSRRKIILHVRQSVWEGARGNSEHRRVLAHEVGHIWLHEDECFGFSEVSEAEHRFIPKGNLVEDQAHIFADNLLLPVDSIKNFDKLSDLKEYCEIYCVIPDDIIERQWQVAQFAKRGDFRPRYCGSTCVKCGSEKVVAFLSYSKCENCRDITY